MVGREAAEDTGGQGGKGDDPQPCEALQELLRPGRAATQADLPAEGTIRPGIDG